MIERLHITEPTDYGFKKENALRFHTIDECFLSMNGP